MIVIPAIVINLNRSERMASEYCVGIIESGVQTLQTEI